MNEARTTIPLTQGLIATVSPADHENLSRFRWAAARATCGRMTAVRRRLASEAPGSVLISMHRYLLGEPTGAEIDHINRNSLDNRRENLRLCNRLQNLANRAPFGGRQFKGVFRNGKGWTARIRISGALRNLGTFDRPEDAAARYDEAALAAWGEFAYTNGSAS